MYEIREGTFQLLVRANGSPAVTVLVFETEKAAEGALKGLNQTGAINPANGYTAARLYERSNGSTVSE